MNKLSVNEMFSGPGSRRASVDAGTRHVFVRNLVTEAVVGVFDHEKTTTQTVCISLDMTVREDGNPLEDDISNVVCYGAAAEKVKKICQSGHVHLIETMAERIAQEILKDQRILSIRIRIEKPEAFEDCDAVGIEIERSQPSS